jgi:hypothetical protein
VLLAKAAGVKNNAKSARVMNAILFFIFILFMLSHRRVFRGTYKSFRSGLSPATLGLNIVPTAGQTTRSRRELNVPDFPGLGLSLLICNFRCRPYK